MKTEKEALAFRKGALSGIEQAKEDLVEIRKEYRLLNQIDQAGFDPLGKLERKLEWRMAEAEL